MPSKKQSQRKAPRKKSKATLSNPNESESEEAFIPNFEDIRRRRLQKKINQQEIRKSRRINSFLWNLRQNVAYMNLLKEEIQLFRTERSNKNPVKINVLMSESIGSRTASQCRSHHQKMMKYHGSIPKIIEYILNLQKDAPAQEIVSQNQYQPQIRLNSSADTFLEDLQAIFGWIQDLQDLRNRMMDQRWLQGADECYRTI